LAAKAALRINRDCLVWKVPVIPNPNLLGEESPPNIINDFPEGIVSSSGCAGFLTMTGWIELKINVKLDY
jgi:hypothetical protein